MIRAMTALALMGAMATAVAQDEATSSVLEAIELPVVAHKLREAGMSDDDVRDTLKATKAAELSAGEAAFTLRAVHKGLKEHGAIAGEPKMVKGLLDKGLEGKELAEAIRKVHAEKGKGKPEGAGKGKSEGAGEGHGKGEAQGKAGEGHGKGEAQGKGEAAGEGKAEAAGEGRGEGKGKGKGKKGKGKGKPASEAGGE